METYSQAHCEGDGVTLAQETENIVRDTLHTRMAGCVITVTEGAEIDIGKTVQLSAGEIILGSGEDCDLVLSDTSVSRRHLRITVHQAGLELNDLGSTNGTKYLGNPLQTLTLNSGGRIQLGRTLVDLIPLPESSLIPPYTKDHYGALVGAGKAMRSLFAYLCLLEKTDAPVLILGETGTGKELIAQALHDQSHRQGGPYIVVDCANLSPELIGSELFGHVKGAFTGAVADRKGAFEEARGGTVFLDELGELPLDLQRTLLRVLEAGEIKRVGESKPTKVNVRVVAATHRDLASRVQDGSFREDLFFRLSVFTVKVPALRERPEDLPLLVTTLRERMGIDDTPLAPQIQNTIMRHMWPGNIRELRNAIQYLHVIGQLPELLASEQQDQDRGGIRVDTNKDYLSEKERILKSFEAEYLEALMARSKNVSDAARKAGISRRQMRDIIARHEKSHEPSEEQ